MMIPTLTPLPSPCPVPATAAAFALHLPCKEPCLVVPLNLEDTLRLHHGRAFVGFTAATGTDTWQVNARLRRARDEIFRASRSRPQQIRPKSENTFVLDIILAKS